MKGIVNLGVYGNNFTEDYDLSEKHIKGINIGYDENGKRDGYFVEFTNDTHIEFSNNFQFIVKYADISKTIGL